MATRLLFWQKENLYDVIDNGNSFIEKEFIPAFFAYKISYLYSKRRIQVILLS